MLKIFLICTIVVLVNYLVKKIMRYCISKSSCASTSVKRRGIYRNVRIFIIFCYSLIIFPELYRVICNIWGIFSVQTAFKLSFAMVALVLLPYAYMSLPISGITINQLENVDFALYLRGFSSDSYSPTMYAKNDDFYYRTKFFGKKKKQNNDNLPFSESDLASAVKHFMPIYSVGMTKELESPEGSKRIYLDDDKWQEGVRLLIEKAKIVLILVNSSDSCIWEILKSQELAIDKTIFFIDNPEHIGILMEKIEYNTIPECVRLYPTRCTYNYVVNGRCHSYVYSNDEKGFLNVLGVYFEDQKIFDEKKKDDLNKQKIIEKSKYDYSKYMPH